MSKQNFKDYILFSLKNANSRLNKKPEIEMHFNVLNVKLNTMSAILRSFIMN